MRIFIVIFLCFDLFGAKVVYLADNNISKDTPQCTLKVNELVDSLLESHPNIQVSRQAIKNSDSQLQSSYWGYFPSPSIDVSQASNRRSTLLRIDQPLWTGGKLDANVDIASSKLSESKNTLDESAYALTETLIRVLQNYLHADKNIVVLRDGKKQLEVFDAMLKKRIKAGASSRSDYNLIKSRISQVDTDLAVALNRRKTAFSQLESLIGKSISCDINFTNEIPLIQNESLEEINSQMLESHPTLKKLSSQIITAEAERNKAKAAIWPNVSLRAEHQAGSVYSNQSSGDSVVYIALQASTGAGLSALSNIQSAEAMVLQARYEKISKEQEFANSLLSEFNDYHMSLEQINGLENTIDASQNVLKSYTRLFLAGKRQWLDLVNSSREVTQNKMSLADLEASLWGITYRLALKQGKIKLISGDKE